MPADAGTLACRSQEPFVKKQAIGRGWFSLFRSSGPRSSSKQKRVSYETANCRKKGQTNSRLICGYRVLQTQRHNSQPDSGLRLPTSVVLTRLDPG